MQCSRVAREAHERAETRHFYGLRAERELRAADCAVLAHAHELLREARAHGRPTFALDKAVDVRAWGDVVDSQATDETTLI